jgi:ubiquinone biosynthesis monooxygenase Coq7
MPELSAADRRTISRILKVNHAGEYGAIRIYRAQLWMAHRLHPALVPFLEETLSHEIEHCRRFLAAMPSRGSRPCLTMWLWGLGGSALGIVTTLMGRNAVYACTKAVEQTVHHHLDAQILFLADRDTTLRDLIADIQIEEQKHLDHAATHLSPSPLNGAIETVVNIATAAVIWLSTQGAVSRMERALRDARRSD